jgi:diguanylate cyclase (GGDEF)-like protein
LACQRLPHTGKVEFETRGCRKDGTLFYKQVILIADLKDPSQGGGHYCFIKDISDRKAAELALRQSEARYRHIVETTLEGVWGLDAEGLTTVVNQRMAEMLGYRVAEMGGRPLIDFMAPADRPQAQAYLERRRQGIEEQHSLRFQRRDGSPLWVIVSASLLQDEVGNFAGWVGLFTDITRAHRKQHPISIIMLDVDHFKRFNDTYGHDAGDYVLQRMSTLLQESVRGSDIVCRYGGEEFTIILPELSLQQAHSKAQDICTAISRLTLVFHQQPLGPITASLGVSVFPTHGTTGAALLQRADEALYRAKAAGRNQVVVAP